MGTNVYTFSGDDLTAFMRSSLAIYTDINTGDGTMEYVGRTEAEVSLNTGAEDLEWWDNTSGTQVLVLKDPIKNGFELGFQFSQVLDTNALALAYNAQIDTVTVPGYTKVDLGSNPGAYQEARWEAIGQGRTGRIVKAVIPRGIVVPSGEVNLGAAGSWSTLPITLTALQDSTIVDDRADLAWFEIENVSS